MRWCYWYCSYFSVVQESTFDCYVFDTSHHWIRKWIPIADSLRNRWMFVNVRVTSNLFDQLWGRMFLLDWILMNLLQGRPPGCRLFCWRMPGVDLFLGSLKVFHFNSLIIVKHCRDLVFLKLSQWRLFMRN